MNLTDTFVLPAGTLLQPAGELPEDLRRGIGSSDGHFALSRPNSRSHSKVVDAEAAALISLFEKPSTIAQAVARFSRGKSVDAERLLEESLPLLQSLIGAELLVGADAIGASELRPSLLDENLVDGWTILRCVQMLEDTEVYQARRPHGRLGALKIARSEMGNAGRAIEREARILSALDGTITPRVFATGEWKSRPYLLMEWFAGADAHSVFSEFRQRSDGDSRRHLLLLAGRILDAYAHLHEQGVTHGDIHPRNILIDRHYTVKIIDLGLGQRIDDSEGDHTIHRGGVSFFFEPEFARALLVGAPPPPPTPAGEQYGLAALLYLLLTGAHYLDFLLEKEEMLRQIAQAPARLFHQHAVEAWPDVERCLETALSKDPAGRFPSVKDFARVWQSIATPPSTGQAAPLEDKTSRDFRGGLLRKSAIGGSWMKGESLTPPTTSLNYGSAGIACALYQMACSSEDAQLLAAADVWSVRSIREIGNEGAFYNAEIEIIPKTVGHNSLYHSPAGVYAAQALIAQARGDIALQCAATEAFMQLCAQPSTFLDVTLGQAGLLLGCVFLLDAMSGLELVDRVAEQQTRLLVRGREIHSLLWRTLDGYAAIRESRELTNLGIAHGWAGLLYASLCWCSASGEPLPSALGERLQQLGECAAPMSRGLQWPWDLASRGDNQVSGSMPGWCNGSAGQVFLWTAAHKALGDNRYLELAEGAAWYVWETPTAIANLCCGMAGQSYALLNLYRHTGDAIWLRRARDVGRLAAARTLNSHLDARSAPPDLRPESLYKGDLGVAVLDADLSSPEYSHMPMFEREP
ncbi:MAG: lanthionine synthetase LanC family protein [Terracidiphilus sp.]|jgi:eukaryotic-like serine/threonine-protein kinase